jgi:hypothetical protein
MANRKARTTILMCPLSASARTCSIENQPLVRNSQNTPQLPRRPHHHSNLRNLRLRLRKAPRNNVQFRVKLVDDALLLPQLNADVLAHVPKQPHAVAELRKAGVLLRHDVLHLKMPRYSTRVMNARSVVRNLQLIRVERSVVGFGSNGGGSRGHRRLTRQEMGAGVDAIEFG